MKKNRLIIGGILIVAIIGVVGFIMMRQSVPPVGEEKIPTEEEIKVPKEEQREELITMTQAITETIETLIKEVERRAEEEGLEVKITEEEREGLREEMRQRMDTMGEKQAMTQEEFEKFKKEMEGIILTMAETIIQKEKARIEIRDLRRKSDMRMISTSHEMYFMMEGRYYQSDVWPAAIPNSLPEMPTDPLNEPPYVYVWVSNVRDGQKFCAYATLEKGGWFTASHRGNFECADVKPTLNDCCF